MSNLFPDFLIVLSLILGNVPCTHQLIYSWLILNHPGLLLLIVHWIASPNPCISLPSTRSLVCFCRHRSFAIKYSPDLWKISLVLNYTIYRPLINIQLPWSYGFDCLFICIADPRSISPTNLVPGLLLSSLVFWYQIFFWFSKHSFHLRSKIDRPLINSQLPWLFSCLFSVGFHCWPQIYRSYQSGPWSFSVITGLLLSNNPLILERNPCTCTPQLIDPLLILSSLIDLWSILDNLGLLLFIVNNLPHITVIGFINTNTQFLCKSLPGLMPLLMTYYYK